MKSRPLSLFCLVAALLLLTAGAASAQSTQAPPTAAPPAPTSDASAVGESPAVAASPLPADIEKAFEKALDKKLAPIRRTLAEMQERKVRLTDVLGGLGYIFGLVGVAAYFKGKSKD